MYKDQANTILACVIQAAGGLAILLWTNPVLAAWGLATGIGYMWIGFLNWKRMYGYENRQREAAGAMAALPYVLIGLGCGAFGHGVGALANAAVFRKYPDVAREKAIEEKDERNVAILNRAKAKALDMMFYVFGALMVSLALMGADTGIVLLLVAAYLFVAGCMVYYMCKYQKEM